MAQTTPEQSLTTGATGKRPALNSLTGMRGVAAVVVFLCHIMIKPEDLSYGVDMLHIFDDPQLRDTYRFVFGVVGYTAVSFFFVLSGFILTWSARPSDTIRGFWRRRIFKIYPLHLVAYPLGMLVLTGPFTSASDIPAIFLVQNWIPDSRIIFGANGPSWSISAEAFFYFLFPALLPLLRKIRESHLVWWLAGVAAASLGLTVFSYLLLSAEYQVWFSYVFPPVRILEFVIGILLARLIISGRWIGMGLLPAGLLLLVGCAIAPNVPEVFAFSAVTLVPVLLVIGAGIRGDIEERPTFLRARVLVRLGDLSFAFYLVHLSVLVAARRLLGMEHSYPLWGAALFIVVTYMITLCLAWLLHTYVENPAMRRWSSPKRKAPAEPPRAALSS
jgi:peptidoglycan/LPS O-acetylase OafA/YrhL